jgi:hypothetical protein
MTIMQNKILSLLEINRSFMIQAVSYSPVFAIQDSKTSRSSNFFIAWTKYYQGWYDGWKRELFCFKAS